MSDIWQAWMLVGILLVGVMADSASTQAEEQTPYLVVLGVAQDGGYPQAGCLRDCCRNVVAEAAVGPVCLGLLDPVSGQRWLFECTPQFPSQLALLNQLAPVAAGPGLDGIFLTHAHVGHYGGLIHLGREVMGAQEIPVYVMPRMEQFLRNHGPWSQLVTLRNIQLHALQDHTAIKLNTRLSVTPVLVPHRDEFSETVAYLITGPQRRVLFLPDIDKWSRWETSIETMLSQVDVAYLDATFYDAAELPGRDMSQIPHPFVVESIERFGSLSEQQRGKIKFIHLNHSNPAWDPNSAATQQIRRSGMSVAQMLDRVAL